VILGRHSLKVLPFSHSGIGAPFSKVARFVKRAPGRRQRKFPREQLPRDTQLIRKTKADKIMAFKVRPIGDRILVEPVEEKAGDNKKGRIIIPDTAKEKPMESMVVAVGPGKTGDDGKKIFLEVKKGDRVLVSKYGGTELQLDGKDYRIFNSDDILAVIE
jgi:chaperonin GroES